MSLTQIPLFPSHPQTHTWQCPGCMTPVTRGSSSNLYVCCQVCSAKTGRSFGFCWQCLREWKGQQPRSDRCENDNCHNSALKTLRECPELQIELSGGIKGCPSVRACPTCGSLLQHTGNGCKDVSCPRCNMEFCFGCLKSADECMTDDFDICGIAARQTSIPTWNGHTIPHRNEDLDVHRLHRLHRRLFRFHSIGMDAHSYVE